VHIDASLRLDGGVVDLASRVLVAGVVPEPRFGREAEVAATAGAVVQAGAHLVDVSLAPRLIGPAVRAAALPVVVRATTVEAAAAAWRAGAAVILVPIAALPELAAATSDAWSGTSTRSSAARSSRPSGDASPALVALVDDLLGIEGARAEAERTGVPLAYDSSRWSGAEAMAREAAAVAEGCRILRTTDVRRTRRVAEIMAAILDARRDPAAIPSSDVDDEGPR